MIELKIAEDYSDIPGGRYIKEGPYSGEDFRERLLLKNYLDAFNKKEKLYVDLDGGYGYGSSFLEEAFGGLVRKLSKDYPDDKYYKSVIDIIQIKSDDEPRLVKNVQDYIKEAIDNENKCRK